MRCKMERFYYACDASSFDKQLVGVDLLVSAALCWKNDRLVVPKYLDRARSILLDSGAFSFKEYPFTLEEYVHWVFEFYETHPQVSYAATPDRIIPATLEESERRALIETSLEDGWDLMRDCVHPWRQDSVQWVFTIQGATYEDYQYAIQYINDCEEEGEGGWNYHMAVGSLKSRTDVAEVYRILKYVRENIPAICSIHAFGLTYRILKDPGIRSLITSADSGAWRQDCTGKYDRYPRNQQDKLRNFREYKKRVDGLLEASQTQKTLDTPIRGHKWCDL